MRKEELIVFTHSYPFGHGESFFETEILYLSKTFSRIVIIPVLAKGEQTRSVPGNVRVVGIPAQNYFRCFYLLLKHVMISLKFIRIEFSEDKRMLLRKVKNIRYYTSFLLRAFWIYSFATETAKSKTKKVYYSYWLGIGALVLSIMKEKGECNEFISRTHGIDLYRERHKNKIVLFQYLAILYAKQVLSVSKAGADYLSMVYPSVSSKFDVSYLGVINNGIENFSPDDKRFSIVSCSSLIKLKRVDLIVESLMKMSRDINWYHIGDGLEYEYIKTKCSSLPKNVHYNLLGQISSFEVTQFYLKNKIDLFIHLSSSEGLPVSMMEAISFGIPLLATDVGGVSEICTADTGVLLPPSPSAPEVAGALTRIIDNYDIELRVTSRRFWETYFDAEKNYINFIEQYLIVR